jgi:uncharacterized protein (TIGR02145 family)
MRNLALMWVLAGVAVALLAACDGKPSVSTFTDKRDGKVYKIVKIGGQTWFAENLNYTAKGSKCFGENGKIVIGYKDHKEITTTLSNAEVQANCAKYGRMYNWKTVLKACPAGTHLPTDKEWTTLVDYVGGDSTAGTKLKSSTGWEIYKYVLAGTDDYGFSALPGGYGNGNGDFANAGGYDDNNGDFANACDVCAGNVGFWWSATKDDAKYAWGRDIAYNKEGVGRYGYKKTALLSVRCVLDDEKERRK